MVWKLLEILPICMQEKAASTGGEHGPTAVTMAIPKRTVDVNITITKVTRRSISVAELIANS